MRYFCGFTLHIIGTPSDLSGFLLLLKDQHPRFSFGGVCDMVAISDRVSYDENTDMQFVKGHLAGGFSSFFFSIPLAIQNDRSSVLSASGKEVLTLRQVAEQLQLKIEGSSEDPYGNRMESLLVDGPNLFTKIKTGFFYAYQAQDLVDGLRLFEAYESYTFEEARAVLLHNAPIRREVLLGLGVSPAVFDTASYTAFIWNEALAYPESPVRLLEFPKDNIFSP